MYILGFDIGGTKCAAVTARWDGNEITLLKRAACGTDLTVAPEAMLQKLIAMADGILEGLPDRIGVSCGGPLDAGRGIILSPPNLPGWDYVEVVRILREHYGVPAALQNDANACALAEWKFGAGKGSRNMAFLTFGTGLGAGLIVNGQLLDGATGNAGELGHIRLSEHGPVGYHKEGSFEGFCSGGGIAQLGRSKALEAEKNGVLPLYCRTGGEITARSVAEAARKGDETALEVYRTSGRYLGKGLAVLLDLMDPEVVVIGSIFARCEDLLWPAMEEELSKEALTASCRILPAALGEQIGDYAAVAAALTGEASGLLERYPVLKSCEKEIAQALQMLISCYQAGNKLLLCGNGGSSADCDHIVGELMKGFLKKRPLSVEKRAQMQAAYPVPDSMLDRLQAGLPAISLSGATALNSAFCNDMEPELVYAQAVLGLAKPGDVLVAISTSGNSKNVVNAAVCAKALGRQVIALTGKSCGKLREIADVCICVPETETYKIQELHLPIYHYLCAEIEAFFFEN